MKGEKKNSRNTLLKNTHHVRDGDVVHDVVHAAPLARSHGDGLGDRGAEGVDLAGPWKLSFFVFFVILIRKGAAVRRERGQKVFFFFFFFFFLFFFFFFFSLFFQPPKNKKQKPKLSLTDRHAVADLRRGVRVVLLDLPLDDREADRVQGALEFLLQVAGALGRQIGLARADCEEDANEGLVLLASGPPQRREHRGERSPRPAAKRRGLADGRGQHPAVLEALDDPLVEGQQQPAPLEREREPGLWNQRRVAAGLGRGVPGAELGGVDLDVVGHGHGAERVLEAGEPVGDGVGGVAEPRCVFLCCGGGFFFF